VTENTKPPLPEAGSAAYGCIGRKKGLFSGCHESRKTFGNEFPHS
jgi:hypothetical protein